VVINTIVAAWLRFASSWTSKGRGRAVAMGKGDGVASKEGEAAAAAAMLGVESVGGAGRSQDKSFEAADVILTSSRRGEDNAPKIRPKRDAWPTPRPCVCGEGPCGAHCMVTYTRLSCPESRSDDGSNESGAQSDTEAQNSSDADAAAPAKRKRGRPRKYEDLTEEERKQRRAVDNRHAAKRSYYRRINKMTELEQVRCDRRARLYYVMPVCIEQ
jgi:hypothetical protein